MSENRPSPAELYRRADALIPVLAGRAQRCEELRHCPPETIDDLEQAGLLQICRSAHYGGYEYGWDVLSEINRILARGCGSQAWVANVLNDHTQLVGAFSLEAQEEIWGKNPRIRTAASVAPSGRAKRAPGGALLSGKFGFASGIDYADWLICGAFLEEDDKSPAWWDFLVPKAAVTVIDDWHVAGLAGTGSKSFVVADVLIPPHRFQDHIHSDDGTGPGTAINRASVFARRAPQSRRWASPRWPSASPKRSWRPISRIRGRATAAAWPSPNSAARKWASPRRPDRSKAPPRI
jgi:alkylation response protein AidB-like acyl-CoA dehydrogenase